MEEITVVIPNYNGKEYLSECLEALSQQDAETPEFQVLVVDNGSTDGSEQLLAEQWPKVQRIMLEDNFGFSHAVNVGIRASKTPYIILLNNDTKVKSGFVKGLYDAIRRDERIFSVSSKMLMWDRPELIDDAGDRYCVLGWAYSRGKGKEASGYHRPTEVFAACAGASIYRRSVFEEIGFFDELHFMYLEDIDIGYRARIYGYRNCYEPSAEVLHYGSASTGSRYNARKTEFASANSVYLIAKNMPLLQWIVNLPFLLVGFFLKFLFFCKKGMGRLYLAGLWTGLKRGLSGEGRSHKVPFRWKHLKNYCLIQLLLYADTLRIIKKS